jgi:putative Ca2+/H+ antiporter (TMEM165/GDT1 family)
MTAALLAFLAVAIVGLGARDQILVARMSARAPRMALVPVVAIASALATTAAMVWGAWRIAPLMPEPARLLFAALALGAAAFELIVIQPRPGPEEPTRSLGAFAIVFLAQQLGDAARFVVLGLAVAAQMPMAAGLGGALGSVVVLGAGWLGGSELIALNLRPARRILGLILLLIAAGLALRVLA